VNTDLLIDLGPDLLTSANAAGCYLGDLKVLLVTHRHSDHWLPQNLYWRKTGFTPTPVAPLTVYGPADALDDLPPDFQVEATFTCKPVKAGDCWKAAGYTITAVPATHGGGDLEPLLYVIEQGGSRLFYATDTAPLGPDAWAVLRPLGSMDLIVLDATSGRQSGGEAHHGMDQFFATQAPMVNEGLIEVGRTTLVAHHFSHNGGLTHQQLVEAYGARGATVAYDGLTLTVP
jgi:phosphoribosyl 1,2-cyclic phosphodiesterase